MIIDAFHHAHEAQLLSMEYVNVHPDISKTVHASQYVLQDTQTSTTTVSNAHHNVHNVQTTSIHAHHAVVDLC